MNIGSIGTGALPPSTAPVTRVSTERPGEIENDGDSDDRAKIAAAAPSRGNLAPGVGKLIDEVA
ncbi:hypothetical protein [Zavarzinia sp.]|uniref:hypothetical protein n=1 Tax=Zavarzinia sp. TaxID=2027920 RepID=UPI00356AFEEC